MIGNNIVWHQHNINKKNRSKIKNQKACILWFTGLSGSGKSTLANAVEVQLYKLNKHTYLLDGDNIRMGLNQDLTFSDEDRMENIRRIGEVSKLFVDSGIIILTAFISPFSIDRTMVRNLVEKDEFIEIFVDTPLSICEERDSKGLYAKAKKGEIKNFTGVSSLYERPTNMEIHITTDTQSIEESVTQIINYLIEHRIIKA